MASKRFKKLPEKTLDLPSEKIEKLIPEIKKCQKDTTHYLKKPTI